MFKVFYFKALKPEDSLNFQFPVVPYDIIFRTSLKASAPVCPEMYYNGYFREPFIMPAVIHFWQIT